MRLRRSCISTVARGIAVGVSATVLLLGAARAASAQDVRVRVSGDLSKTIDQELQRMMRETLPAIRDDISDALRDMADGLDDLGTPRARPQNGARRVEQTDTSTQPLPMTASGTLDIRVVSGGITVTAGTGAPTLQVIKKGHGRTDAEARAAMDRVTVPVETRGGRVHVEPAYHGRSDVDVTLVVTVPAGVAVNASTTNGAITISGIRGDVEARTMNGAITLTGVPGLTDARTLNGAITIFDTQSDRALSAESMSGAITFSRVRARRLSANTSGTVLADGVECGEASLKAFNGSVTYRGSMARNGHYEFRTFNGPVHFEPTGSVGFELDASSYSGSLSVEPPLRLQTSRTSGHSLTGTVGDGAATVTIVTFNGAVVIGKR